MTVLTDIKNPSDLKSMSLPKLAEFADEVRGFLINTISKTGGHIGANLGTVDLSLALHYVFDSPRDKIIWDTGHQGYTHKLVTGRIDRFNSLNTYGGMNRFVSTSESDHDIIEASHAGTSISVALGIALSKKLKQENNYVIAVIGDGSFCEGLAQEALNHAAAEEGLKMIIVLNDNGYSISPGFGSWHNYLETLNCNEEQGNTVFSSLGMEYIGPVNGHDIDAVTQALHKARHAKPLSVIHLKTIKGNGMGLADKHPNRMHFSFPFDTETGELEAGYAYYGYQDAAASVIEAEMELDDKLVCITPSTLYATGLSGIFEKYPERCFDPGMEEQHAMSLTVGFALEDFKPVIFYQSTFMQRAFDQLIHDVCFTNKPTLILSVRSGFAGYDNPTHHGIYDFSYLSGLPNLKVMYPKDRFEVERMVRDTLRNLRGPTIIFMPYGPVDEIEVGIEDESDETFANPQLVWEGDDLLLITIGNCFSAAKEAALNLRMADIECGLLNLRYLKPLPEKMLETILKGVKRVVTIEESVVTGGVGSEIASLILEKNLGCQFLRIGIPSVFVEPGSNEELCRLYGLDGKGILSKIQKRWTEI